MTRRVGCTFVALLNMVLASVTVEEVIEVLLVLLFSLLCCVSVILQI